MRSVFILGFLLVVCLVKAQNLVLNPSFEDTVHCPNGQNQVSYAVGWHGSANSPDYFNSCSNSFSVPFNWGGYQEASTGNAYCAVGTITPYITVITDVREFIRGELNSPLVVGQKYYVSFQTSLSVSEQILSCVATDKIGAMFSTVPFYWPLISNNPPLYSNEIIADTVNWTPVFGSFVADSSYNYIILGNFFHDAQTNFISSIDTSLAFAYYYIDDVCVSIDSLTCVLISGEDETEKLITKIFPNPNFGKFTLNNAQAIKQVHVFNTTGQLIYTKNFSAQQNITIEIEESGFYFVQITTENEIVSEKVEVLRE